MKKKLLLILILLFVIAIIIWFGKCLTRNFKMVLNSNLGNECAYIINDAVQYAVAHAGNLAEMLTVEKNDTGVLSYVYLDNTVLNQMSLKIIDVLENEMTGLRNIPLEIPLGNLISSQFFSGKGPMLQAEAYPQGGIDISYQSNLTNGGINQVLFSLDLHVTVEMESVFGFYHYVQRVERNVPVCNIVIVGNVPETYANLPADTDFLNLVP